MIPRLKNSQMNFLQGKVKKSIKLFMFFILLILILIGAVLGFIYWSFSEDNLANKDIEFINNIGNHFNSNEDFIKVSDIHKGNWVKVCILPSGLSSTNLTTINWLQDESFDPSKSTVTNDSDVVQDESAIIFINTNNEIKVYKMNYNTGEYKYGRGIDNCLAKESAYLKALVINRKYQIELIEK